MKQDKLWNEFSTQTSSFNIMKWMKFFIWIKLCDGKSYRHIMYSIYRHLPIVSNSILKMTSFINNFSFFSRNPHCELELWSYGFQPTREWEYFHRFFDFFLSPWKRLFFSLCTSFHINFSCFWICLIRSLSIRSFYLATLALPPWKIF